MPTNGSDFEHQPYQKYKSSGVFILDLFNIILQTPKISYSLHSCLFAQPVLRDHMELAELDISWAILVWIANTSNWSSKDY
jgi:hypothetical protein